jgi:hypothetical protein
LTEVEAVVESLEQADSVEAAAGKLRLEIELPGALRWLRRRAHAVHTSLRLLKGLMPDRFSICLPLLLSFRTCLGLEAVLLTLRADAADHLAQLPAPLGFCRPAARGGEPRYPHQQRTGPDPPRGLA